MMRKLLISALIAVPVAHAQVAGGVFVCSNCAEEATQLTNKASLISQISNQLHHIQIALNTYNQIMIAGRLLSNMQWGNAQQDLMNLSSIVQVGTGLAFSLEQLDRAFTNAYPGFSGANRQPYYPQYRTWSQTALDTIRGTLRGTSLSYQQFQNEMVYAQYLKGQAHSAMGEMQAVTLGAQISVEMLGSIQKLRQIYLADMESKQAFQAYNLQKEMQQQSFEQAFFAPGRAGRDGQGW
jgi:type IV secretion system protein TrbJ